MKKTDRLSSLYPEKAAVVLQNLYAEEEVQRISEDGELSLEAISLLNPSTAEDTLDIAVRDLLSNEKAELTSMRDGGIYSITEEGYEFTEKHFPTDKVVSQYERTDLSSTDLV